MTAPDPYEVLGVARSASASEIRAAYLALIRKHHPDLALGADAEAAREKTSEINAAFRSLRLPPGRDANEAREVWPGGRTTTTHHKVMLGAGPRYSLSQRRRRINDVRRFHLLVVLAAVLMLGAGAWLTWQLLGRSL